MTNLDPTAAERVHYATDPRIRHLAEAAWRMRTGGTRNDWLMLGKDNPEALISEAREWVRAAVAGGLLPAPSSSPEWKAATWRAAEANPTTRTLTQSEYSAAWHAVEGAAGEEGADPGTVLHAVLDRLGIACPGAEEQLAIDASERCGKCRQPFNPADTAFDGCARYHLTPYCRGCVDRCHESTDAFHRCVICDS